jgi:tetratricopeptide (TPR) repeat protein
MRVLRDSAWRFAAAILISALTWLPAEAQIAIVNIGQADLVKLGAVEQSGFLADVVRASSAKIKCAQAQARLERTYNEGAGGWLVRCAEGQDYWVVMPAEAGKGATTLPCMLARTMARTDCYADFRTVSPAQVEHCQRGPHLDWIISGCTAIIQSGRADGRPEALAVVLAARGIGFARYGQFALALNDFNRALSLNPTETDALYNRAVAHERMGHYDLAITDLNEVLRLRPDHANAIYERGYSHLKMGNFDLAIQDLDQSIRINPDAKAYRSRGNAHQGKGDERRAQQDFAKAKQLEPTGR